MALKKLFLIHILCIFPVSGSLDRIDQWTSLSQRVTLTETMPTAAAFRFCTASIGDNNVALFSDRKVFKA